MIGRTLLGQSGRDLFLLNETFSPSTNDDQGQPDARPILAQMADQNSSSYKGLALFKHLVLYANATNDHTVPFFTAYITAKDPFKVPKHVRIVYQNRKPDAKGHVGERPLPEIDVSKSRYIGIPKQIADEVLPTPPRKPKGWISPKTQFYLTLFTVGPIVLPIAVAVLSVSTIASDLRVRLFNGKNQDTQSPELDTDEIDSDTQDELEDSQKETLLVSTADTLQLFDPAIPSLNLDPMVVDMIDSLNKLPWDKHIVRFHRLNTHDEIVNSMHNSGGPGKDLIEHWAKGLSSKL